MLKMITSGWSDSQPRNCTPRHWAFPKKTFVLALFMTGLFVIPLTPALSECDEGPYAARYASGYFTRTANESLGLDATIWTQRSFNSSGWWAEYGNLTWAFDPNLAFWTYFQAELATITAAISSEIAVERVEWGMPLIASGDLESNQPWGDIIDYNNGSYRTTAFYPYPWLNPLESTAIAAENLTFVLRVIEVGNDIVLPLAADYWRANVYWDYSGLSMAQWTELTKSLSDRLNATWYMKASVFDYQYAKCDETTGLSWPFEVIVLGLLAVVCLLRRKRCDRLLG